MQPFFKKGHKGTTFCKYMQYISALFYVKSNFFTNYLMRKISDAIKTLPEPTGMTAKEFKES